MDYFHSLIEHNVYLAKVELLPKYSVKFFEDEKLEELIVGSYNLAKNLSVIPKFLGLPVRSADFSPRIKVQVRPTAYNSNRKWFESVLRIFDAKFNMPEIENHVFATENWLYETNISCGETIAIRPAIV